MILVCTVTSVLHFLGDRDFLRGSRSWCFTARVAILFYSKDAADDGFVKVS